MDLGMITLWGSQIQKDKYSWYDMTCMWNLQSDTMNLLTKEKNTSEYKKKLNGY